MASSLRWNVRLASPEPDHLLELLELIDADGATTSADAEVNSGMNRAFELW